MRVRVHRIESVRNPDGNLGKRIELVEESVVPRFAIRPQSEEARMVQDMVRALQQQLPMFQLQSQINAPKIILFLTEQEYEELGIDFNVNQVYDVDLSSKSIGFTKVA